MTPLDLIDYAEAAVCRDASLKQVSENSGDWMALAFATAKSILWLLPDEFTPEMMKHQILLHIPPPHSPNAFGALTMKLIRAKEIEKTGRYGNNADPASHRTCAPLYRRCH
jgi:hypothetical protein